MAIDNAFSKVLNKVELKLNQLQKLTGLAKMLMDIDRLDAAYAKSLEIEEVAEELVLLTRSLPVYSGRPCADTDVSAIIKMTVPVEIGFTQLGWFSVRIPMLLPKKEKGSVNYIRSFLYPAMRDFFMDKRPVRITDCVLIYRHVYDKDRPERRKRDHDNIEINMVSDIVALYVMPDDGPSVCTHYYCSAVGKSERTEIYVISKSDFPIWFALEKSMPEEGVKLFETR